ncbi:MAG: FtsW/RodA/SpoVE family cell cycle protein [Bacilli bacterium]
MKNKPYKYIIISTCIIIFMSISIISIYNSSFCLSDYFSYFYIKQIIFYILSFIVFIIILFIGNDRIIRLSPYIYTFCIILLILVLIFGTTINNTKGWFSLGFIHIQPSEIMKIGLILLLAKTISSYKYIEHKTYKSEAILILKVFLLTLLPSILVFIEPDTGSVIMYFLISIFMLFMSKIHLRWYLIIGVIICVLLSSCTIFYLYYRDSFINILGNNFYYRLQRLLEWFSSYGMQLENSLITISHGGIFGKGIGHIPIYIPESYSDFIFSIYSLSFGLIGSCFLIIIIIIFIICLIYMCIKAKKTVDKYIISGFICVVLFSFIYSISLSIGLVPIMGIPLPFISYGGSSLITYMILLALVINSNLKNLWCEEII